MHGFRRPTHQDADGFFEDAEDLEIRVRSAIEQDSNGMKGYQRGHIERRLALPTEVRVDVVEDAIP
jgi:hypothetical protein